MIPIKHTAYGFIRGSKEIVRFDNLPVPDPHTTEILLKVETAGLCRSDHHILISQSPGAPDRMVMGHEICGTVTKAGSSIADDLRYKIGARFCVFTPKSCGTCDNCREGKDNHCITNRFQGYGITQDGGFQQYLLVNNPRNMIPIPHSVSFGAAASATDAVLTPFHAIMKVKDKLTPTSKILVLGAGGLGLHALQIIRHFGSQVVCIDQKAQSEKLAKHSGAHEFYTSFDDLRHEPESFDVSFDFIGNQQSVDCSCEFVGNFGKIVMVGMGKSRTEFPNFELSRREIEVIYNFGGTSREQAEVLRWIASGKIVPVVEVKSMSELPEYMSKMKKGQIVGRIAFRPAAKL